MARESVVILGAGYTGQALYRAAKARGLAVYATSRHPHRHLSALPESARLTFDLGVRTTWSAIPSDCAMIWCFPARPLDLVQAFAAAQRLETRRLVVLGSTSAYRHSSSDTSPGAPLIDEHAPLDLEQPRVQAEEYLRTSRSAIVLRAAGIYGPGRNPLDWIRERRVGTANRYVNLIHVEDLAAVALELCERGTAGEAYNVSDGLPRRWSEICGMAQAHWAVTAVDDEGRTDAGKRLDTAKLRRVLGRPLLHLDLYEALARLEAPVHPIPTSTARRGS